MATIMSARQAMSVKRIHCDTTNTSMLDNNAAPRRRPSAIRNDSSSSLVPNEGTGKTLSQAPASAEATDKRWALD